MDKIQACRVNGEPWYKWGDTGTCFAYTFGDNKTKEEAKTSAEMQGREIEQEKTKIEKSASTMQMIKSDNGFNTVLFVALVPFEIDRNGDIITEEEITKTAHEFVRNLWEKSVNVDHVADTDIKTAEFVESFVAPVTIPVGLETIPKGSWVVGIKFDDDTYKAIQDGEFVGISIEGVGQREEISKS